MRAWGRSFIGMLGLAAALTVVAGDTSVRAQSSVEDRVLAAEPGGSLLSRIGFNVQLADVSRNGVSGQVVDLQRIGDHLRGHVGDADADLVLQPRHVAGDVGGRPVSLDVVSRPPHGLEVAGRFGDRTVAIAISPAAVTGDIGPCRYRTEYRRDAYVGELSCGGEPEAVELQFPAAFAARDDVELAALLTAILAG
jgi:hypothetical protein